jgi:hypothetical protein
MTLGDRSNDKITIKEANPVHQVDRVLHGLFVQELDKAIALVFPCVSVIRNEHLVQWTSLKKDCACARYFFYATKRKTLSNLPVGITRRLGLLCRRASWWDLSCPHIPSIQDPHR